MLSLTKITSLITLQKVVCKLHIKETDFTVLKKRSRTLISVHFWQFVHCEICSETRWWPVRSHFTQATKRSSNRNNWLFEFASPTFNWKRSMPSQLYEHFVRILQFSDEQLFARFQYVNFGGTKQIPEVCYCLEKA